MVPRCPFPELGWRLRRELKPKKVLLLVLKGLLLPQPLWRLEAEGTQLAFLTSWRGRLVAWKGHPAFSFSAAWS